MFLRNIGTILRNSIGMLDIYFPCWWCM